jgi:hypothetical protein
MLLDGIVLASVIILRGAVLAMVLTRILARIVTVILGRNRTILATVLAIVLGGNRTFLATVFTVILGRDRCGGGYRCWNWSGAIRFTRLALWIHHTGFSRLAGLRRVHNNVRLLFLFAFAIELGVTASTAHKKESKQEAVNQWFTHLKTS